MSEGNPTGGDCPDEPQLSARPPSQGLSSVAASRIAVDTGGTFTDFVHIENGTIRVFKILSTPLHPERAILEGLAHEPVASSDEVIHGSTVATNALLERKGARTALVTTKGFEDVLAIGRQTRPDLYSIFSTRPEPLVPARLRLGLHQRTLPGGVEKVPLDPTELGRLVGRLRTLRVESIAVSLLFSFEAPEVERAIGAAFGSLAVPVSLSSAVLPEFREYERTSTTVINAYLAPVMSRYLESLRRNLPKRKLRVMQSNGGAVSVGVARAAPVRTLLSGPAGGVVGAFHVASMSGHSRIVTFDMGGTSTDVALLDGGIAMSHENTVDGMPVGVPMMDIHTVGAGGGSIARLDSGGALQVGPESAGAEPGPICYGRGMELTVTDANVLLGRLQPRFFLGGAMDISADRTRAVLAELPWTQRWPDYRELASGILRVVNSNMEQAIRLISVERGHDARDYALVSFGGAGGLHAADLARGLGILRVLVPPHPGALSALGLLLSDARCDYSRSLLGMERPTLPAFRRVFSALHKKGIGELRKEGFSRQKIHVTDFLDVRYEGQAYELTIPFSSQWEDAFHEAHERRYGHSSRGKPLQVVTARATLRGDIQKPSFRIARRKQRAGPPAERVPVWSGGRWRRTSVYDRAELRYGNEFDGPAVVGEYSSTTWVPPDFRAEVDRYGNLILIRKPAG